MPTLFDPIKIGRLACPNRIFMVPLTPGRATRDHVPTGLMADYYAQRASAGLIISEATGVSVEGSGWPYAGGLWGAAHVAHWKNVTDAVHVAGGRIFAQLWHMGRLVHPSLHGFSRYPPARPPAPVRRTPMRDASLMFKRGRSTSRKFQGSSAIMRAPRDNPKTWYSQGRKATSPIPRPTEDIKRHL